MARFLLTPCHIREDRVIADGDPIDLDWPKVSALLAPTKSLDALMTLRRMSVNAYVGLVKKQVRAGLPKAVVEALEAAPPTNFLFQNKNKGNEIGWLLKRNPEFPKQVQALYRVDLALFDAKFEEPSSGIPNDGPA